MRAPVVTRLRRRHGTIAAVAAALLLPLLAGCAKAPAATTDLERTSSNGTISQAVVGAMSTVKPAKKGTLPTSVGQSTDFYGQPYPVMAQLFGTAGTSSTKTTIAASCPTGSLNGAVTGVTRNVAPSSSATFTVTGMGWVENDGTADITLTTSSTPVVKAWDADGHLVRTFSTKWNFSGAGSYTLQPDQRLSWSLVPATVTNAIWFKMLSVNGSPAAPMKASWVASQVPSGCVAPSVLEAVDDAPMYELHH